MVRAYHNVRATGGAVFFPLRGENTRERWSPFKVEGDGGCSKKMYDGRSKKEDVRGKKVEAPFGLRPVEPCHRPLGRSVPLGQRTLNLEP